MNRLDRYIFYQLLGPFGVFTLIFAGILWIAQNLQFIEIVVDNRQNASAFLEFAVLMLPHTLAIMMSLSSLAAGVFLVNRMINESEISVMFSSGVSPYTLARPFLLFGGFVAALLFCIEGYLQPLSLTRLNDRIREVQDNAFYAVIRERQFFFPAPGISIFVVSASSTGSLDGLFLKDTRQPERPVTFSAEKALLLKSDIGMQLVMSNGTMTSKADAETLDILRFNELAYNIALDDDSAAPRDRWPTEYFLGQLFSPETIIAAGGTREYMVYLNEGLQKVALISFAFLFPVFAFSLMTFRFAPRRSNLLKAAFLAFSGLVYLVLTEQLKAAITRVDLAYLTYLSLPVSMAGVAYLLLRQARGRAANSSGNGQE